MQLFPKHLNNASETKIKVINEYSSKPFQNIASSAERILL